MDKLRSCLVHVAVVAAGLMLVAIAAVFYLFGGNPLRGGIQGPIEPRSAMTIDDVLAGFESLPGLPVTDSAYVTRMYVLRSAASRRCDQMRFRCTSSRIETMRRSS